MTVAGRLRSVIVISPFEQADMKGVVQLVV